MQALLHPMVLITTTSATHPGLSRISDSWLPVRVGVLGMACRNVMHPGLRRMLKRLLGTPWLTESDRVYTSMAAQLLLARTVALEQRIRLRLNTCATGASSKGSWILHHHLHRLHPVVSCRLLNRTHSNWTGMNSLHSAQLILLRHGMIRPGHHRWLRDTHLRTKW